MLCALADWSLLADVTGMDGPSLVDVEDLSLDVACLLKEPMDWNSAKAQEDGNRQMLMSSLLGGLWSSSFFILPLSTDLC